MFDFFERLAQTIAHHGDTYLTIAEEMYLKDDRNFLCRHGSRKRNSSRDESNQKPKGN